MAEQPAVSRVLGPGITLVVSFLVLLALAACSAPEPLPTYTPYPTHTSFPTWTPALTATPYPTGTPLPTHTPFPTWTPGPTATPYPTSTSLPTHTPYPTWTPGPTASPYPTYTPLPTFTAAPTYTPYPTATAVPPTPRPTNTPRPTPTSTPEPWTTYRHSRSHNQASCNREIDFYLDIHPSWTNTHSNCAKAEFESRDEAAEINVVAHAMPNYSANRADALREILEDYSDDFVTQDILGYDYNVQVLSTKQIKHRGIDALYQELEATPELSFIYCTESLERMIVMSPYWTSKQTSKRAFFIGSSQCKGNHRHDSVIKRSMESFRFPGQ